MATVENHFHNHVDIDFLIKKLDHILKHQHEIMGKIDELTSEIQTLKTSVAEERAEVNAKLDEQTAKIDQLQQAVNDGGTPEQLTSLIAEVKTINEEVKGIYTAPTEGGGEPTPEP